MTYLVSFLTSVVILLCVDCFEANLRHHSIADLLVKYKSNYVTHLLTKPAKVPPLIVEQKQKIFFNLAALCGIRSSSLKGTKPMPLPGNLES